MKWVTMHMAGQRTHLTSLGGSQELAAHTVAALCLVLAACQQLEVLLAGHSL